MRTIRGGRHGTVAVVIVDAADLSTSGVVDTVVVAIVVVVVIVRISISPCSQLPEASQPPSPPPAPEALLALTPNLLPLSAHRCSLRKDFSFLNDVFKFLLLLHTDTYTRTFATTCE